jgi:hypothetical protein
MKKSFYSCVVAYLLTMPALRAQTVSGSWYGRADVDVAGMHNNYLTELVIKQKGNRVEGIFGYYFRDKYQSFFIHGTYNPRTREITILNIPVIYYNSNSTVNSIDCNTNFRGVLMNSKAGSSLKGAFYNDGKYKYTCPDLKVSYALDKGDQRHDSLTKSIAAGNHIWKPQSDDFVVDAAGSAKPLKEPDSAVVKTPASPDSGKTAATDQPAQAATAKPGNVTTTAASAVASNTEKPAATAKPDSAKAAEAVVQSAAVAEKEDSKKIAESFTRRAPVLNKVLEVESDSVRLSFYDNGEIDGDSISVFVNNHLVLKHQELAAKAFNLFLRLDSSLAINEISMFAENLGKYPPNTALMVVTDGKNRYEVFMSSSLTETATIRLKRKNKL